MGPYKSHSLSPVRAQSLVCYLTERTVPIPLLNMNRFLGFCVLSLMVTGSLAGHALSWVDRHDNFGGYNYGVGGGAGYGFAGGYGGAGAGAGVGAGAGAGAVGYGYGGGYGAGAGGYGGAYGGGGYGGDYYVS